MANITVTLTDTAGFTPQAWANKAMSVLRNAIVLTKIAARDSDFTDAGWRGKSLTVPYPGTFATAAKTAGSLATLQTPSNGNSVALTLGNPQTVDFILEDVAFAEANSGMTLMDSYGEAAGVALAEKVESDLLGLITGGYFTGQPSGNKASGAATMPGAIAGTFDYTAATAARKSLVDNKAPSTDRYLILGTKAYAEALADSKLLGYFQFQNAAAITDGKLPPVMGMQTAESQLMPVLDSSVVAHSVQQISVDATGGTFTVTYSGQTTGAQAFNVSARNLEDAINGLSNMGAGSVRVSGGPGDSGHTKPYLIAVFKASPAAFTTGVGSLTGGAGTAAVADYTGQASLGLAMHKNAVLVAFRPMQTITTPGVEVAYANDPLSGISLRVQMQVQPQYRGLYVAYDILYGYTALRASQATIVLN